MRHRLGFAGKERWRGGLEGLTSAILEVVSDEELWSFCSGERADLVDYLRMRLARQLSQRGEAPEMVAQAQDETGKQFVQEWDRFIQRPEVRIRAVFLEDYDMALAQELVQGVDVWINTPRRPWEACGTSGMKVLVNGGLNLSELDGWWAEAYTPEVGWRWAMVRNIWNRVGMPLRPNSFIACWKRRWYRYFMIVMRREFHALGLHACVPAWPASHRSSARTG